MAALLFPVYNRMGKTRDLFKKIRDTKATFHAKMSTIRDRNDMHLTEAEDIKKRWQKYTEKLYKKYLHDPDNHNGMITHLESDILECEVKWALRSITTNKANGGDGVPVELFQILKDDIVKVLHQYVSTFGKITVVTGLENLSFNSTSKERQSQEVFKLPYNCAHFTWQQGNARNPSS